MGWNMYPKFLPNYYYKDIYSIDFEELKEQGIRGLLFDLDNTICAYTDPDPDQRIIQFFHGLEDQGFTVALVSNNSRQRVERFNRPLGLPIFPRARKPLLYGIRHMMRQIGLKPEYTALIGDQVYTDVWGGNRAGLTTVLVYPIKNQETPFFRMKRRMEQPVLCRLSQGRQSQK